MKITKYLSYLLKDFLSACGCLMLITAAYLGLNTIDTIKSSFFWQIILIASAYTLFKAAFVNKFQFPPKVQLINFTLCSVFADFMVVLWLFLFSPGRIGDKDLLAIYIIIILVVKGAVYAMMYIDGDKQAKQLNEKLSQYRSSHGE